MSTQQLIELARKQADHLQQMVQTYPQVSEDEPGGYCTEVDQCIDEAVGMLRQLAAELERADSAAIAAYVQKAGDAEDAARWREWLRGNALTVVVPTPTEKNPASKTTIVYAPSHYSGFASAMNAAIDAARNHKDKA